MKQKIILIALVVLLVLMYVIYAKRKHVETGQAIIAHNESPHGILQDSEKETLRALSADLARMTRQNEVLRKHLEQNEQETQARLEAFELKLASQKSKGPNIQEQPVQKQQRQPNWVTVDDKTGRRTLSPMEALLETPEPTQKAADLAPKPAYTLPIGTKLLGATTFDVLIGRIPIKGKVTDPYPFSVILSADNLAANGHRIPGIKQAIATGTVVGDFNLTCARADIYTLSFVFEDGTISQTQSTQKLGYLSNDRGAGCIAGIFVSDAAKYIAAQIGMASAQGAATALSESQLTHTSNSYQSESFISGSTGKFILGESIDSGMAESRKWLSDRLESSFDAIVVSQGQHVNLTLTEMIEIDYNPKGRKVNHDYQPTTHTYPLD